MTWVDLNLTKITLTAVFSVELTREGCCSLGLGEDKGGLDQSWGWDRG